MKFKKENRRRRIHYRVRNKIKGTAERPRISVFRSNKEIYAQLVDDRNGHTLLAASSLDAGVVPDTSINKTEQAKLVGKALAEKAKSANIEKAVFDRGGYLYHGRVKALAEGAREGGLQF
ncbi:MAG TPA: 50S ribosomal protein L18 [Bacteroidetes bacterium]|nr:50S ribosomal protein L18 [Bacteroidota bacterium]